MFIHCSACNSKYLVNSADLKPDGRLVECASCGHQWYQKQNDEEELFSPSVPSSNNDLGQPQTYNNSNNGLKEKQQNEIKNLPSTFVNENKASTLNSFLVIIVVIAFISSFWILKSYGSNIFVLINYYINEFYFNLKLIIMDIAKIVHQIIN